MGETWFTADLHLGHKNIIGYCRRPFRDVTQMNEELVDRCNEVVAQDDTLVVLGDLALGDLGESLEYASMINGTKYLVLGNHDRPWRGHKKPSHDAAYQAAGFTLLEGPRTLEEGRLLAEGASIHHNVRVSHFPVTGDSHDEDRYTQYRPVLHTKEWLLHGHVHDAWRINGKQLNVGVDVWDYYPVSWTLLQYIMDKSPNGTLEAGEKSY